jgi:hypothetical protein
VEIAARAVDPENGRVPYFAEPVADEHDALLTFLECRARIVTAIGDLGQPSAVKPEQSVRWVLFHLIQETSRHAGHADIIRETLDGRRADQLLDAYEAG